MSNFMSQFIRGKLKTEAPAQADLLATVHSGVMPDAGFSQEHSDWQEKPSDVASSKQKKDWMPAYAGMTNKTVDGKNRTTPLIFSAEAQAVFEAGRALYTYYHQSFSANTPHPNPPPQGRRGYILT